MPESVKPFSRFTARAARTLAAAGHLAAPGPVSSAHLAAALPTEPEGLAAKAIATAGIGADQLYAALGTGPAERAENTGTAELLDLSLDESAKDAVKSALKAALRLGHNYIGTEHFLLGLLASGGPVAEAFTTLGLSPERAEQLIAAEIAAYQEFQRGRAAELPGSGLRRPGSPSYGRELPGSRIVTTNLCPAPKAERASARDNLGAEPPV
jgi:ATP-dependent Clp protease ATP-binding subunit ClpA